MTYDEWKQSKTPKKAKQAVTTPKQPQVAPVKQPAQAQELHASNLEGYNWVVNAAKSDKIAHNPVEMLPSKLTSEQIIDKIAGGDETQGSCASLSLCYAANKCGIDVSDFRGGNSQSLFCYKHNNQKVYEAADATVIKYTVKKEMKEVGDIITGIEPNKEYILSAGKHSAVIRKTDAGLQYLELQSQYEGGNGWKPFETQKRNVYGTLHDRFGCRKTVDKSKVTGKIYEKEVRLVEVDSFKPTEEFREILGYINTPTDKQKKGVKGAIK
jgi:hypothetical protein